MNDSVNLSDGYGGFDATNRAINNEAQDTSGLAKKQHGHTENLLGNQKGSFAKSAANGSTAAANNFEAFAKTHGAHAEGGSRFLKTTAAAEEEATSTTETQARTLETQALDIKPINQA